MSLKLPSNFLKAFFLVVFLVFCGLSVFQAENTAEAARYLARLLVVVILAAGLVTWLRKYYFRLETVLAVIALFAIFQSAVGFGQFLKQESIGLKILGEPVLGQDISGVAKIEVSGQKIIRSYGTFPHPNILAAFLILGLFSLYYFWLTRHRLPIIAGGILVILTGLILTFSRMGWAIGALLSFIFIIYFWKSGQDRRRIQLLPVFLAIFMVTLFAILQPYIFARLELSAEEPAVALRSTYNKIGFEIIKSNLLGIGLGNQVFYSTENRLYQKYGLTESWQRQPIHNLYLLMASEIGILGLAAFIGFIVTIFSRTEPILRPLRITIHFLLFAILLFGLADHFLWTQREGILMLWLTIALVLGLNRAGRP